MANTVQHKRGTTAQVSSHTGAVGEFIYNTTTKRIHAQDGVTAGGVPHALVSEVNLKANESVTISAGAGLTGGGTLAANRTLALSSASIASLALADSAVQSVNGKTGSSITLTKADVGLSNVDNTSDASKPISTATQTALNGKANSSVTVSAGSGLTGGGNLTASRSIALNAASIASLGKADTALQAPGGTTGQILAKNSAADNDVGWVSSEAATAVSYAPQVLTEGQQEQARENIGVRNGTGSAHITHIRNNAAFPGVVYDRIVITKGSLRMQTGEDIQSDGSIIPRTGLVSTKRDGTRVAINASAFFNRGDDYYLPAGLYINDGVPYQEFSPTEEKAQEAIVMYRDGVMRPARMSDGKTAAQYVAEGALWSTGWGPLLVVDGVKPSIPSTVFNNQVSARTVLGQRANGDYVILLVEGKTNDYGVTMFQMQDLCLTEGLTLAMNLDGGGTTQCWWDTAYAHPSSDDTPRRIGNYLTTDGVINPFDTGLISLPLASGIAPFSGSAAAGGVRIRQVDDDITVQVAVNASPEIVTTAYTLLATGVPSRFWPENGALVRGMLGGSQYRPVSLGMPHPLTGEVFARAAIQNEPSCSGTVIYKAKWSGI